MRHVGRILTAVLVVFVLAVLWYARAGEAVVMQCVFTNTAGIVEGTVWVRPDKGLFGGSVTAIASLPLTVQSSTPARGAAISRDGGTTWQRLNSGLPDLDVRRIVVAGGRVFAMTGTAWFGPRLSNLREPSARSRGRPRRGPPPTMPHRR